MTNYNFYKKTCLFIALLVALVGKMQAQSNLLYPSAILDPALTVTSHSPFVVTTPAKVDSVVWIFFSSKIDTVKGQPMFIQNVNSGYVYVFSDKKWTYNSFTACGSAGNPCAVSDLLIVDGVTCSVSPSYPMSLTSDFVAWQVSPGVVYYQPDNISVLVSANANVSAYGASNGVYYEQTSSVGIEYDSLNTGALQAPVVPNATYQWYVNGVAIYNAITSSYEPNEIGTYTVVISWTNANTRFANARTEDGSFTTATFTFNVTKLANPTGIVNENLSGSAVQVYPNPANEQVYINAKGAFDYTIENANTSMVMEGVGYDQAQVNLRGMNAGVYYIHIKSTEAQTVKRLVVK